MENKVKNVLSGIGFYGTLAVCLLVVGVCGWVLLQDREDPRPQQAVTPQVPVSQPVEMPEVRLPTVETLEPAPVPVPPKETKELPEVEVDHTPVAAEAPRLVVAPLRGDVLTAGGAGIQSYFGRLAYPQRRGHRRPAGNHGTGGLRRGGAVGDGRSPDGHHRGAGA